MFCRGKQHLGLLMLGQASNLFALTITYISVSENCQDPNDEYNSELAVSEGVFF